jgi:hypothetical protein
LIPVAQVTVIMAITMSPNNASVRARSPERPEQLRGTVVDENPGQCDTHREKRSVHADAS